MNFPSFFSKKNNQAKHYLGLFLRQNEAVGFVFKISLGKLQIVTQQKIGFSNGWENILEDIDQLLLEFDKSLKVEMKEVIFFVYSYFINDQTKEIVQPYKDTIKKIIKNLELKPLGYIECYEAIAAYMQQKEGSPLNAVLVELDTVNFGVFIYKGGKKIYGECLSRTDNFADDFETVLKKARNVTMIPSRVILYDSEDIDQEANIIRTHQWSTDLFIHLPRVEVIKEEELNSGLANIFFDQLTSNDVQQTDMSEPEESSIISQQAQGAVESSELNNTLQPPSEPTPSVQPPPPVQEQSEVMGFVIGQDIPFKEEPPVPSTFAAVAAIPSSEQFIHDQSSVVKKPQKKSGFPVLSGLFGSKKKSTTLPIANETTPQPKKMKKTNPVWKFIWIPGIALIIVAIFMMEYFFHKATLTVYLPSQTLQKDFSFTSSDTDSGFSVKSATYAAIFTDKKTTTGKRQVGDKAHGEITIHNFDDKEKIISKGTSATSGNYAFTLDQDVKVASASEATVGGGLVKEPGKAKVTITAKDIGPEYNLDKNQRFKIDDLSSSLYFGMNDAALSGGSKKDVKIVAKKDADDLKASVLEKGKSGALDAVRKTIGSNIKLLDNLTEYSLGNNQLSKEVGDEATEVTLQAKVNTKYYYYDSDALKQTVIEAFKPQVNPGYSLQESNVTFTTKDIKKKDTGIVMDVSAQGKATKQVAQTDVLKSVQGKSKASLDSILKTNIGASAYEVSISTPLFFMSNWMPFFSKNIDVRVSTQ